MKKLENFVRCLAVLRSADAGSARRDEIYRAGVIAQFSLTFEMAWKALQTALRAHAVAGAETGSPREILKLGFAAGFVGDEDIWLAMMRELYSAAHIYGREDEIVALTDRILRDHILAFDRLAEALAEKLRAASA